MTTPRRLNPTDRAPTEQAGIERCDIVKWDHTREGLDGNLLTVPGLVPFGIMDNAVTTDRARLDQGAVRYQRVVARVHLGES